MFRNDYAYVVVRIYVRDRVIDLLEGRFYMNKRKRYFNVNWEADDTRCTIITDYGEATLVYGKCKDELKTYDITIFRIDSKMISQGKGQELMDKIFEEARNKDARYLCVIPDFDVCRDGIELSEALSVIALHKNDDPQSYVEERYKSYGFKKERSCDDGSSHWVFQKDLRE